MLSKIGGRKMAITLVCLGAAVAIDLTTGRGLSENLMMLMITIIGTYTAGNVTAKFLGRGAAVPPVSDEKLKNLEAQLQQTEERLEQGEQYLDSMMTMTQDIQKQMKANNNRVAALMHVKSD